MTIIRRYALFMAVIFLVLCGGSLTTTSYAHGHAPSTDKKVGILLVAFGSSEASAQVSFENIDKKVKAAYPGLPVRWAYTSHIIREKLGKQGRVLDSPEVALAKMLDEKFSHVAVQSLHTIGGAEYHDLRRTVGAFKAMGRFEKIILGYPMMASQEDMARTVTAVLKMIPAKRKKSEAVVLMGHGTPPPLQRLLCCLDVSAANQGPPYFCRNGGGLPRNRFNKRADASEKDQNGLSAAIHVGCWRSRQKRYGRRRGRLLEINFDQSRHHVCPGSQRNGGI